jgi:hypothetical protein
MRHYDLRIPDVAVVFRIHVPQLVFETGIELGLGRDIEASQGQNNY